MNDYIWDSIYALNEDWYGNFISRVKYFYDISFPLVTLSRKRSHDKPWVTTGLKNSVKRNHNLYSKSINSTSEQCKLNYKKYNKILRRCLINAEKLYYKKLFEDRKNAAINTWKALGPLLNTSKTHRHKGINTIKLNGTFVTDNEEMG